MMSLESSVVGLRPRNLQPFVVPGDQAQPVDSLQKKWTHPQLEEGFQPNPRSVRSRHHKSRPREVAGYMGTERDL